MNALQSVSFKHVPVRDPRVSSKRVPGRHAETFWSEAEDDAVRTWYPVGGAGACMAHLPKRTRTSIYGRANKLGVEGPRVSAQPRRRNVASPELDETIREAWQSLDGRKKGEVGALADRLGLPRRFLYDRALNMGLVIPHSRKEPDWTAAELDLLRKVPLHDVHKSAEIFRDHGYARSPNAIKVRATRLKISRRDTREQLSARKAAKILGIDDKGVTAWILSGDLVATKRDDRRTAQQGGSAWDIEPSDLKRFVVDKLEFVDFRKVDKFALVDLLVRTPDPTRQWGWTADQDEAMRRMWSEGETAAAIAHAVGKSAGAVNVRRSTLDLPMRRVWTKRQDQNLDTIRTMSEAGRTDPEIAAALGITAVAVGDRRRRLGIVKPRGLHPRFDHAAILDAYEEGLSVHEVADRVGCTRQTVYNVLAGADVALAGRRSSR